MIKIAFDGLLVRPPFTYRGFLGYTQRLLEHFRLHAEECGADVTCYVGTLYAPEVSDLPPTPAFRTVRDPRMDRLRSWRFYRGARVLREQGAQVVFSPNPELVTCPSLPMVVTIHDVAFLRYRQHGLLYSARLYALMWLVAWTSRTIITDSESSKADIVRYLGVRPEKVRVVYLGYNRELFNESPADPASLQALRARLGIERPYILHHGTLQPRKNLARLVRAYELLLASDPTLELDLVLAGNRGWNYDDVLSAARRVAPPGRVVFTDLLAEEDLATLVKGARLEVVPSLCEGFCFPMIEAMACGIPTVVADNSCLPEVSGGVLRYFDATDVEQIAATVRDALHDPALREQLRVRGLDRVRQYSWDRCAKETLEVIARCLR